MFICESCLVFCVMTLCLQFISIEGWHDYDNDEDFESKILFPEEDSSCTIQELEGKCKNIWACKLTYDLGRIRPPLDNFFEYLERNTCGFEGKDPMVCCVEPESINKFVEDRILLPAKKHLLPDNCGEFDEERIIGGNQTDIFQFPWMALLEYRTARGTRYNCGGSLISSRYVLTAAHCTRRQGQLFRVLLGEHNIRTDPDCQRLDGEMVCAPIVQKYGVEKVIPHPRFDLKLLEDDIALIRLSREVNLTKYSHISPICLPIDQSSSYLNGTKGTVTGWGFTGVLDSVNSPKLLRADLPIQDLDVCKKFYRGSIQVNQNMICAGGEANVDTCFGDSGGPLIYPGFHRSIIRYIQHGIVSAGRGKCGSSYPGIFTRVDKYVSWILENIEE